MPYAFFDIACVSFPLLSYWPILLSSLRYDVANKKELANQTIEEIKVIPKAPIMKLLNIDIEKLAIKMIAEDIQIFPHLVNGKILLFASMNANEPVSPPKIIKPTPNNVA